MQSGVFFTFSQAHQRPNIELVMVVRGSCPSSIDMEEHNRMYPLEVLKLEEEPFSMMCLPKQAS